MARKRSPASAVAKASQATRPVAVNLDTPPRSNAAGHRAKKAKRKTASPASVVAQARRNSGEMGSVESLEVARLKRTKLRFSKDLRDIRVEFPGPGREPFVLDISFLAAAPRLAKPLAEGFRIYGIGKRPKSIMGRRSELQVGFLAFLREKEMLHIGLDEIDRSLWNRFKQWLDTKTDSRKGGVIHPKTRSLTFGALVAVLDALKSVPEFSRLARIVFDSRPSVTWDYVQTRTTQRARLSFEALQAIDRAVTRDLEALNARVEMSEKLLNEGNERLASGDFDLSDLATCAAFVAKKYPEGLPALSVLREHDPDLWRYVECGRFRQAHGVATIKGILYPDARDLVSLVVFMAIESTLNPTTLFELCWSDVDAGELLGEPVIRLGGAKWRAGEDPLVPIPAARIGPVLELIRRLTKHVRLTVPPLFNDRLFLFSRLHGENAAGRGLGVDDRGITNSDLCWQRGLAAFCQDHQIEAFTLSQVRATIGDEIALREGIVVSSQVLGHQNTETTEKHYVSDGTRWREAEHLGNAMLFRDRWFRTNGKIDPRRRRLTPRMDRGAATPGFYCFDPYDSPWPMQRKNRLCTAYGRCPSCPLAAADISNAGAVALYLSLRTAIFDAQGRISGEAWLARYSQVLVDLDALLKQVPLGVMEGAALFHVKLPPVE